MTRLVGQGAVHLVAGEFAGCAQSGAVELSRPPGLWCAKLVGNALWRAVLSGQQKGGSFEPPIVSRFCPAVGRCRPAPQKGWVSAVDSHPVRLRVAGVFPALLLLEDVRWAFWTPAVVAGVFVGRRRLHGSYTTASTAAALWFQPVVPETVARSLKAVGFLGVARGSWDFRRMESCAIIGFIAQRTDVRKRPFSPLFLARIHGTGLDDLWALATGKSTAGFRTRPAPYQSS